MWMHLLLTVAQVGAALLLAAYLAISVVMLVAKFQRERGGILGPKAYALDGGSRPPAAAETPVAMRQGDTVA